MKEGNLFPIKSFPLYLRVAFADTGPQNLLDENGLIGKFLFPPIAYVNAEAGYTGLVIVKML
jgi:hypothetical protein